MRVIDSKKGLHASLAICFLLLVGCDSEQSRRDAVMDGVVGEYCQKLPGPPVFHREEGVASDGGDLDFVVHRIKYGVLVTEVNRLSSNTRHPKAFSCVRS